MSNDDLVSLRIGDDVYARVRVLARELKLLDAADQSELIAALARSGIIASYLPAAFDDTHDLEEVLAPS